MTSSLDQNDVYKQTNHMELNIGPLLEVKIDRLKDSGISQIFVSIAKGASQDFRESIQSYGAEPIVFQNDRGELGSFSVANEYISNPFIVTKANRVYPPSVVQLLSDFELRSDFLLAVDRQIRDDFDGLRVFLSDDLVRPKVLDIGEYIVDWNAMNMGIYLASPVSLYEATALVGEGKYGIEDLIGKLDSRVLPFDGVNWYEVSV